MAQLVTTAVLRAHDQMTGPLSAMASKVRAMQGRFSAVSGDARKLGGSLGGVGIGAGGAAFGVNALLQQAEQFNKNIFGIGAAGLTEAMDASGKIDLTKPLDQMKAMEKSAMEWSRVLSMSATKITDIQETLAKAGMDYDRLMAATKVTATLAKADTDTDPKKIAEFMATNSTIYKPRAGENYADFIRRQGDALLVGANETKSSLGGLITGLRQFQSISAGMGMDLQQNVALLMQGIRGGMNDDELGTAVKSGLVRVSKMTAGGQAALAALGIDMSKFSAREAQDPTKALGALSRSTGGLATAGLKVDGRDLKTVLFEGARDGISGTDGFLDMVTNALVKEGSKKGRTYGAEDRNDLRTAVKNAVTTTKGNFNFIALLAELAGKGGTDEQLKSVVGMIDKAGPEWEAAKAENPGANDAQLAEIFEGRQLARMKLFLDGIRSGQYQKDLNLLYRSIGQVGDATNDLWTQSAHGRLEAMQATFKRLGISLVNSPGIQNWVNQLGRMGATLETANPALVQFGANAVVLGAAAPFLLASARALKVLGVTARIAAAGTLSFVGAAGAGAVAKAAGGLRWMALGFAAMNIPGGKALATMSNFVGTLGMLGRFTAIGLVGGAIYSVAKNWDYLTGTFSNFAKSETGQAIGGSLGRIGESLGRIGGNVATATADLLKFFGISFEGTTLASALDFAGDKFLKLLMWIEDVTDAMANKFQTGSNGAFSGGAPVPDAVPSLGGMETGGITLAPSGPANVEMSSSSANAIGNQMAEAFRSAVGGITINAGSSSPGTVAKAPAPTTANGSAAGGR